MKVSLLFVLAALTSSTVVASEQPVEATTTISTVPQQAPAPDQQYKLGPEDELSIHVVDLEEISDKPVRIDPSGFIDLPLVGRIRASGLTVVDLRNLLSQKLAKYIQSPQININVLDYRSESVSILGAVNSPGVHQLKGPQRLIDIISLAGGLKPEAGQKLTITRHLKFGAVPVTGAHNDASGEFSIAEIPLGPLTSGQDPSLNVPVYAHDVISISRAAVVYVVGEVKKAGGFSLETRENISLLRALSLAEGMTHEAAPRKAKILRAAMGPNAHSEETEVDIKQILDGKAPDVALHADDVLFIPNNVSNSAMKRAAEAAVQIATGVVIFH